MPTNSVSYATLTGSAQMLVAAAGTELLRTSYVFRVSPGGKYTAAIAALERSLMEQRMPQRTIASAFGRKTFGASSGTARAENDEVISSVGHLWRDGWRIKKDAAQHCVRFIREVSPGAGPCGEIVGLRSFADLAHVLAEWHEQLNASQQDLTSSESDFFHEFYLPAKDEVPLLPLRLSHEQQVERPAEARPTVKRSRFFSPGKDRARSTVHGVVFNDSMKSSEDSSVSNGAGTSAAALHAELTLKGGG